MNTRIRASLLAIAVSFATTAAFAADPGPMDPNMKTAPTAGTHADAHAKLDAAKAAHADAHAKNADAATMDAAHADVADAKAENAKHHMSHHHHHHHHGRHHHHHHHTMKSDMAPAAPADDSTKGN